MQPVRMGDLSVIAAPEEQGVLGELISMLRHRELYHALWREEVRQNDAMVAHRWHEVLPRDFKPGEMPMIADLPRVTVEDGGRLFREARPMEIVDAAGKKERDQKKAELREQVLNGYSNLSGIYGGAYELAGEDMIAAGLTLTTAASLAGARGFLQLAGRVPNGPERRPLEGHARTLLERSAQLSAA